MPDLIAASPAMQPILALIDRVGPSDASVLVTGENGTGKGVVARALHAVSRRAAKPIVSVNVAGSPRRCSRASCSVTCAARSPTPRSIASAASSWRIAGPSSSTRSPTPDGTGIGLVLARQIAEAHGGTLTLRNRDAREG